MMHTCRQHNQGKANKHNEQNLPTLEPSTNNHIHNEPNTRNISIITTHILTHTDPGVIKEVAMTQCGGEANLNAAVARGDVIKGSHQGRTMFFFPSTKVGQTEKFGRTSECSRGKETTTQAMELMNNMVDKLGWSIGVSDKASSCFDIIVHLSKHIQT